MAINLLGISVLMLFFAALLIIGHYGRRPGKVKKPSKGERRAHPRYKTSLRVRYKTPLEEGISWIRDISESGARLFLNRALKTLEAGEPLGMEIHLPSERQPIAVQGSIVWSKEEDAGFRFDEVMEEDLNRILQYVNKEE